jgi:hypothetical protein
LKEKFSILPPPAMSQFAGNLNHISLAEVLRLLSGTKQTGLLKLRTETEQGHLALEGGVILHAITGTLVGAPALHQFIVWREADFEFVEQAIPPAAPRDLAVYEAKVLIDGIARKIDELAALQQAVPTFDSVLYYLGSEHIGELNATPSELGLLIKADGRRTVQQIAHESDTPPLEVARILAKFRLAGAVELVSQVIPVNPGDVGAAARVPTVEVPPPLPEPEEPIYWRGKRIN